MQIPDYGGGSIVNLMASIVLGLGGPDLGLPCLRTLPAERVAPARRVVLLVVDGLGFDFLVGHDRARTFRSGLVGPIDSVFPPTTATAVTAFLTGLPPSRHGLVGWFTYFREVGTVATVLPYTTRHGRQPLSGSGVSAAELFGLTPVFDRLPVPSAAVLPAPIADSEVSRALAGRARRVPYRSLSGMVRRTVEAVRRSRGRVLVYAYWSELDRLAHRHGVGSDRVAAHLVELDLALEALRQALEGSGTLLVVTADHGFVDVPPERQLRLEDYPELASALALPLCGEPRTAYCYVRPHLARRFPERVAALLGDGVTVHESASLIREGWLGPGPTHPRLDDRVGDWTLLMADGYALTDRLQGEERHRMVGFHGGASDVERRVPLVAWEL